MLTIKRLHPAPKWTLSFDRDNLGRGLFKGEQLEMVCTLLYSCLFWYYFANQLVQMWHAIFLSPSAAEDEQDGTGASSMSSRAGVAETNGMTEVTKGSIGYAAVHVCLLILFSQLSHVLIFQPLVPPCRF